MVRDPRLAQPLMDISSKFQIDRNGGRFEGLTAKVAGGEIHANVKKFGWEDLKCEFRVVGRNLPFGPEWVPVLIPAYQKKYPDFQPEGRFDCDLSYRVQSLQQISKKGTIDIHDMSFQYTGFPVKIKNAYGRFSLVDNHCQYSVETKDPQYPLQIDGWFQPLKDQWRGRMVVRSTKFHPFGASILKGFSRYPKTVEVLTQLNASGFLATAGVIEKKTYSGKPDIQFTTKIQSAEIQHQQFPYRIGGIQGTIDFANGDVKVGQLKGNGSTGHISATAKFLKGRNWSIQFDANALELNQSLYQALQPEFKEFWDRIRPKGILDLVTVKFNGDASGKKKMVLSCRQRPATPDRPSFLSLSPVSFPYQMDSVSGGFRYEGGSVVLDTIRAKHRNVDISFDGRGKIGDRGWDFVLTNLLATQIPIDGDFKAALPLPVRQAFQRINLQGSMGISGKIAIQMASGQGANVDHGNRSETSRSYASMRSHTIQTTGQKLSDVNWNLRLDLVNAKVDAGAPFRNIYGVVHLLGARKNGHSFSYGELDVESTTVDRIQLRNLKGPFSVNADQFSFGTAAHLPKNNPTIRSLTAFLLDGRVNVDGRVLLKKKSPFTIQATASHIDLKKIATQVASPSSKVAGLGYGSIHLTGDSRGRDSLRGKGIVRIKDAKLYEIPVFLQLLKILQVRTPDKTAFDEGKIDFEIQRREVVLNRIELLGNAISLIGKGIVRFDQSIDLDFYTVLGRNQLYFPVLTEILKAGSQQLLWISIEGTIGQPKTRRETLRALNEAVRSLLDDVQAASKKGS